MSNQNQALRRVPMFLFVSFIGALITASLTVMTTNLIFLIGFEPSIVFRLIVRLVIFVFVAAKIVSMRPERTWIYGPAIGYFSAWLSGLLFETDGFLTALQIAPLLVLLVSPIPIVIASTIGAIIGTKFQKK